LHIISSSSNILFSQNFTKNRIHFHVVKYGFPLINRGFPYFFPYDSITWYSGLRKQVNTIINQINPQLIHVHGIEKGFALCALENIHKSIISIQGIYTKMQFIQPTLKGFFQKFIEKYSIIKFQNFGCRTNWDSNFVKELNQNAEVYNMPELINQNYFNKKWVGNEKQVIVFVGSIIKRKGIEVLISALKLVKIQFPQINLKLIGSYSKQYYNYLQKIIKHSNLESNIHFLGVQNNVQISKILSEASVFVLPTFIDNSPNSLAEAMAVGMPCIASDVGGIPSMITDNFDGLLFPSGNFKSLSEKILEVLNNKNIRKKLSENSKNTAINRNTTEVVLKSTLEVYQKIALSAEIIIR